MGGWWSEPLSWLGSPLCGSTGDAPGGGSQGCQHSPQPYPEWAVWLGTFWQLGTQGCPALGGGTQLWVWAQAPAPTSRVWREPRWWIWSPPSSPEGSCATRWPSSQRRRGQRVAAVSPGLTQRPRGSRGETGLLRRWGRRSGDTDVCDVAVIACVHV